LTLQYLPRLDASPKRSDELFSGMIFEGEMAEGTGLEPASGFPR
jgi:hypothetical protein